MHPNNHREQGWRVPSALLTAVVMFGLVGRYEFAGQIRPLETIRVDDPRPLAEAIRILEKQCHCVITYEDPPYICSGEVADVTASVRRDYDPANPYDPKKPRVLVPRGGPFEFESRVSLALEAMESQELVLRLLLADYHKQGYPGGFRLLQTASAFHVVPSTVTTQEGQVERHRPVLDTRISIPPGSRTAREMLKEIVEGVSKEAGVMVVTGLMPWNLLFRVRVEGSASNEPARAVLSRTLQATNTKLSWQLFYDPGTKDYVLNLHPVN